MENKKNVKQNFLQRFSYFNFRKKKEKKERRKKKEKKRKVYFVITLFFMSPTTQHIFYHLCFDREISDMILIIRRNISSNSYNQYC